MMLGLHSRRLCARLAGIRPLALSQVHTHTRTRTHARTSTFSSSFHSSSSPLRQQESQEPAAEHPPSDLDVHVDPERLELIYESPQAHVIKGLKRFSLFGCSMGLVSAPFLWSLAIAKGIPVVPSAILSYCGAAVGITTTTLVTWFTTPFVVRAHVLHPEKPSDAPDTPAYSLTDLPVVLERTSLFLRPAYSVFTPPFDRVQAATITAHPLNTFVAPPKGTFQDSVAIKDRFFIGPYLLWRDQLPEQVERRAREEAEKEAAGETGGVKAVLNTTDLNSRKRAAVAAREEQNRILAKINSGGDDDAKIEVHEALEGLFQRIYTHDKRLWVEEQQELEQEQQTFEQEAAMKREEIRTRKLP